jgi:hypothetical protein
MAVLVTPQTLDTKATLITSTAVTATLEPDITGGSCLLHSVKLTNAHATDAFFKIWNSDGASVVVGTTAPDWILYAPGSDTVTYTMTDTATTGGGVALTGLSIACLKREGVADGPGTEGTSNPTGNVALMAITTPT